ncbi:MAG: acetyl-coenzyme A synthetase N-terminal domain-containing protein, partial [Rubrivivax sp.]
MSSDQATASKIYLPPADLAAAAAVSGMAGYQALCAEAEADYEGYWARLAREFISWKTPFTKVLNSSTAPMFK